MTEQEPQQKPRRHPRDANLDRFLAEVRTTRQAYLGITEHMREAYADAVQDAHNFQAELDTDPYGD